MRPPLALVHSRIRSTFVVLAAALVAAILVIPASGARAATSQQKERPRAYIFVIDLSGSMNEKFDPSRTKLEVAKDAFYKSFSNFDAALLPQVGLRVYGDKVKSQPPAQRQQSCQDTRAVVEVGKGTRSGILTQVKALTAQGDTPISTALEKAYEDIPNGALGTIVLFSDGRDECYDADLDGNPKIGPSYGPAPCDVAKRLARGGTDVRLNSIETIGFRAGPAAAKELTCIAKVTNGTFTPVETAKDIANLPNLLVQLGPRRVPPRLCDNPIAGKPTMQDAPLLAPITSGEARACYADSIAVGEKHWYRSQYGPGAGDTTVTFFGLPDVKGLVAQLQWVPGPQEHITPLEYHLDNAGSTGALSVSLRCPGCRAPDEDKHEVFWEVALTANGSKVNGRFDLELLLEGQAWGGMSGCLEGERCFYKGQLADVQRQIDEKSTPERKNLQEQIDSLTQQIAAVKKRTDPQPALSVGTVILAIAAAILLVVVLRRRGTTVEPTATVIGADTASGAAAHTGSMATIETTTRSATPSDLSTTEPETTAEPPAALEAETPLAASAPGPDADSPASDAGDGPSEPDDATERPEVTPPLEVAEPAREAAPKAGWYDDPRTPGQLRWWDGSAWTGHTVEKGR